MFYCLESATIRSKSLDIKIWQPWKYDNNLCVMYHIKKENMEHFMSCSSCKNISCGIDWKEVLLNDIKKQYEVAQFLRDKTRAEQCRAEHREDIFTALQGGQPLLPGSRSPGE